MSKLERNKFGYYYKGIRITRRNRNRWSVYSGELNAFCFSLKEAVALIDSRIA